MNINLGVAWATSTNVSLRGDHGISVVCDSKLVTERKTTKSTKVFVLVVIGEFSIVVSIIEIIVSHTSLVIEARSQDS